MVSYKQLLIFLLVAMLLILPASVATFHPPLVGQGTRLITHLVNQQPDPVAPGEKLELRFRIENNGSALARAVEFRIEPAYPFTVLSAESKNLGSIGALQTGDDGVIAKFTLIVTEGTPDGEYEIKIGYKSEGTGWVTEDILGISVQSREAIVAVSSTRVVPARIAHSTPGKVSIVIKNYATSAMTDLTAVLDLRNVPFSPLNSPGASDV